MAKPFIVKGEDGMGVSDKVRQRRQARIRYLQERCKYDPELAWKYRDNPWEAVDTPPAFHTSNQDRTVKLHYGSGWSELGGKLLVALIVFACVWGMFQMEQPWAEKGQAFVITSLTQSADFESVEAWYDKWFGGSPAFIPNYGTKKATEVNSMDKGQVYAPVHGKVIESFEQHGSGINIETASSEPVIAFDEGRVSSITDIGQGQVVMMIQHADGIRTVYGHLTRSDRQPGDWVKGGEQIGEVSLQKGKGWLFFAIRQNGQYVNPTDVIAFD